MTITHFFFECRGFGFASANHFILIIPPPHRFSTNQASLIAFYLSVLCWAFAYEQLSDRPVLHTLTPDLYMKIVWEERWFWSYSFFLPYWHDAFAVQLNTIQPCTF
jgi:hypothetical protein